MWLPKDERRLLTGYYHSIGNITDDAVFRLTSLGPTLMTYRPCKLHQYGDEIAGTPILEDREQLKRDIDDHFDASNRARTANNMLAARGLIVIKIHQHDHNVIVVSLTVAGYDLGRKYASRWDRTGLWFAEYKDHWIWLVLSFFGGILGALTIKVLESRCGL